MLISQVLKFINQILTKNILDNYYGNTEVYDERAVETEAVSEELTAELTDSSVA